MNKGKMKRIHFDNMRSWVWISVLILSIVFILAGTFELIEFENPKLNNRISAFGFLLQVIFYGRMFLCKNYVQWNKQGTVIRINSWKGKSLSFNQIKKTELNEKELIITKKNNSKITFNLNEIAVSDAQKLNEIIVKNTIANTV
jgi:hypothetical protein